MTPTSEISTKSKIFDARLAKCLGIRDSSIFNGFTGGVWEQKPAVWTAEDFPVQLGLEGVKSHFHEQMFREADVRLVKGGKDILTPATHIDQRGFLRAAQVWSQLADGATLVIKHFDRHHAHTGKLCRELEMILHQPVIANLYVTPKSLQGLPLHQDYHDVLVCQLDGAKRWEVHECREIPTESSPSFPGSEADAGQVILRHTLLPNEIMYAPRGSHHRAIAGEGGSVHVTLGIHAKKWADLFAEMIKQLLETEQEFRRSLPIGFLDPTWRAQDDPAWPRLMEIFGAADPRSALDDLRRRLLKWCSIVPDWKPEIGGANGVGTWEHIFGVNTTIVRTGLAHFEADNNSGPLLHLPGLIRSVPPEESAFAHWLTQQTRLHIGGIPFDATPARLDILRQFLEVRVFQSDRPAT